MTSAPQTRSTDYRRIRELLAAKRDYERAKLRLRLETIRLRRLVQDCARHC
jgi:hypothetical protein